MTHFSSSCIRSPKPQQPPAAIVFLVDCSLTTKLQLVPAGARVCSPAAVQQQHASFWHWWHQGWQAPRQSKHAGLCSPTARVSQNHVLTLLWAAITVGLPRSAAVNCRSPSGDLQASSYATRRLDPLMAQERAVLLAPRGRLEAAEQLRQALPKLLGSVLGAGGRLDSHFTPPNQEQVNSQT